MWIVGIAAGALLSVLLAWVMQQASLFPRAVMQTAELFPRYRNFSTNF